MKVGDTFKVGKQVITVQSGDYIYTLENKTYYCSGDNRPLAKDNSVYVILPFHIDNKINQSDLIVGDLKSISGTLIYSFKLLIGL